jgi:hypothetical protein
MESQQIVDYIRQQLAAGHTEARLRQHLLESGWPQGAITDAFKKYQQTIPAAKAPKSAKSSLKDRAKKLRRGGKLQKRTRGGARVKWAVALAVVAVVIAGAYNWRSRGDLQPVSTATPSIGYSQKQSSDINIVAGAVVQYSVDNGELPRKVVVTADGQLTLCSQSCDAGTAVIASLMVYDAYGVRIVPYEAGFTTNDKDAIYLIPGAKCADTYTLGSANTNPRAMVIMYAQVNGRGVTPRCITL